MPDIHFDLDTEVLRMVRKGLHDLAQPLTAMQCRLWLGTVDAREAASSGDAFNESLAECERMIAQLRVMQDKVETALSRGVSQ